MGDRFYKFMRIVGRPCFFVSSQPTVIGQNHIPRTGPFVLAATHQSPYDIPVLIRHTPRLLDFVSITEVFRNPFMACFYGGMNAFPLERSRPDAKTVRVILDRLKAGRAVTLFPEGRIPTADQSVLRTGKIRRGLGRIAILAGVPVVPCVVLGTDAYWQAANWLPLRRTRYGVIFGQPLPPSDDPDQFELQYVEQVQQLGRTLAAACGLPT